MGIRTLQPRVSVINSLKGVFHQIFGSSCQYAKNKTKKKKTFGPNRISGFVKMTVQTD